MAAEVVEAVAFGEVSIPRSFVIQQQGKDYVLSDGLLVGLEQLSDGYYDIDTEPLQLPTPENGERAFVRAVVVVFDPADGRVRRRATGLGDANPGNVGRMVAGHVLRMAETRAVARALRHILACGMTSFEELGQGGAEASADERTPAAAEKAPVRPSWGTAAPPAEHILIGGKPYARADVLAIYAKRLDEAKAAGLVIGEVDVVPPEQAPLATLVAKAQEIRRRLEGMSSAK